MYWWVVWIWAVVGILCKLKYSFGAGNLIGWRRDGPFLFSFAHNSRSTNCLIFCLGYHLLRLLLLHHRRGSVSVLAISASHLKLLAGALVATMATETGRIRLWTRGSPLQLRIKRSEETAEWIRRQHNGAATWNRIQWTIYRWYR